MTSLRHKRVAPALLIFVAISAATLAEAPAGQAETATRLGYGGTWSDTSHWSTAPYSPNNGTPAGAAYDVTLDWPNGTVTLDVSPTIHHLIFRGGDLDGGGHILTVTTGLEFPANATPLLIATTLTNPAGQTGTIGSSAVITLWGATLANAGTFDIGNNVKIGGNDFIYGSFQNQGTLNVTNTTGSFVLGDAAPGLTFNNTGILNLNSGTASILATGVSSGPFQLAPGTTMQFGKGYTLAAGASITGGGAIRVYDASSPQTGTKVVTFGGSASYSGSTRISNATLRATAPNALSSISPILFEDATAALDLNGFSQQAGSLAGPGVLSLGGATLTLTDAATTTFTGTISGSGQLTRGGSGVLRVPTLRFAGTLGLSGGRVVLDANGGPSGLSELASVVSSGAGQFDLVNNDLLLHQSSVAAVTALIRAGYANGAWNGDGIVASSATAANRQGLGILSGADYQLHHQLTAFDGVTIASSDVLVKYTYLGDATLDGRITLDDYAQLDAGFLLKPANPTWVNGDFNYDGLVDYRDYALIDSAFAQQSGPLAVDLITAHAAWFGSAYTAALPLAVSVLLPEPASLLLLAAGATALLRRRR